MRSWPLPGSIDEELLVTRTEFLIRAEIFLDDHRLLIARALLWGLGAVYRYKDQDLAHRLRVLANEYDTRPRQIP